jgi:mono/diheme cytochrome c family protein
MGTVARMNIAKQVMKRFQTFAPVGAAAIIVAVCLSASVLYAADPSTNSIPQKTAAAGKRLTGADLYAINCNRCHPDRFPVEWKSAQGETIIVHMRVRANIPAVQARLILKYLQEESGN